MKLWFVSSNYLVGGIEKLLHSLCGAFRKRYDVRVCLLRRQGSFVEMMRRDFPTESLEMNFSRAIKYLTHNEADVIHSFGLRGDLVSRIAAMLGSQAGIVSCIPNPDLENSKWKKLANQITSDRVSFFWADCRYRAEAGVRLLSVPEKKVRVIYPGIDPEQLVSCVSKDYRADARALRTELRVPNSAPLVMCVGNLRFIKGHALILQAVPAVLKHHGEAVFVFVGSDFTEGRIPAMAKQAGLARSVRFLGYREDAVQCMLAADLILQPSLSEGFPRAVLEAMALGRAVIASRVAGISEMIQDDKNGCLIAAENVDELACKIIALLNDPMRRRVLGESAKETVAKEFSMNQMIEKFDNLYSDAVRNRKGSG